jgi:hypothetical protein
MMLKVVSAETGLVQTTCGNLKFMFYFLEFPDDPLGVVHPVNGFQP